MGERVVIVGASDKPGRFSNRAQRMLGEYGHEVVLVNPALSGADATVAGLPVLPDLGAVAGSVDTVTMYIRPELSASMGEALARLNPRRVIFNPGSESPALRETLEASGIAVQWECTLVLLGSGRFDQ